MAVFAALLVGPIAIVFNESFKEFVPSRIGSATDAPYTLVNYSELLEPAAFWEITFPLARTGIIAGTIFAFAFSMDDVAVSLFLTDPKNYTLPVALISSMRANFDLTIAAAALFLVAFTVVLILVLDRLVGLDRMIGQGIYRS